jgi:hypothetical protein
MSPNPMTPTTGLAAGSARRALRVLADLAIGSVDFAVIDVAPREFY